MRDITIINAAVSGGVGVAFAMIGVCFMRFWRSNGSRLFLLFAVAFFLLTVERVLIVLVNPDNELAPYIYSMRLLAFLVIIAAIIDQNRRPSGGRS
jgi:hypothetical protein